jgi:uncharacterized membrane protein
VSAFFIAAGTLHFVRPGIYERIMPAYLPAHRELVLLSGAAEIAGGVAVAFPRTRRGAGFFLAGVLAAVFPANVQMAVRAGEFAPIPPALLWARLPLQPLLMLWTLRATRRES